MKKIKSIILLVVIVLCNFIHINSIDIYANESNENMIVPNEVNNYFTSIFEEAISIWNLDKKIDYKTEYRIGEPFVVYRLTENNAVWYYPIYNGKDVICNIVVSYICNEFTYAISEEYVTALNCINSDKWIIYAEKEKIYLITQENKLFDISNGNFNEILSSITYSEIYNEYVENYNCIKIIKENNLKMKRAYSKGGSTRTITNGRECIMTDCLIRQYNYSLCWAASIASIVRYLDGSYINKNLNAFDVATVRADYYDLLDPNQGANDKEMKTVLALYGVYYSVLNRRVKNTEIVKEIDNGYPIIMGSKCSYIDENGQLKSGAHATVLYGYYNLDYKKYYKVWNPGNATTQIVSENTYGDINLGYNGHNYLWYSSLAKGTYVVK